MRYMFPVIVLMSAQAFGAEPQQNREKKYQIHTYVTSDQQMNHLSRQHQAPKQDIECKTPYVLPLDEPGNNKYYIGHVGIYPGTLNEEQKQKLTDYIKNFFNKDIIWM